MKDFAFNTAALCFLFGPAIVGTALWFYTDNPAWLFAWVWTLILGLAG